jgi:hypothetical protein
MLAQLIMFYYSIRIMKILSTTQRNARIAAVLLTAASPLAAVFPVAAQDMKLGAQLAACDQIKDPAKSAQCHWDAEGAELKARKAAAESRDAAADVRGAAADQRVAAVDASIACAKFLVSKKTAGATLDPTRLNREKGCAYAKELGMQ